MYRWSAILLLVFLPFQFSWAALASYCQHETGTAAQHFGHHEHVHQANSGDNGQDTQNPIAGIDSDCTACHASCVTALVGCTPPLHIVTIAIDLPWPPDSLTSPPSEQPERPNWSVLT